MVLHHKRGNGAATGVPAVEAEADPGGVGHQQVGGGGRPWRFPSSLDGQHLGPVRLAKVVGSEEVEGIGGSTFEPHYRSCP